MSNKKEILEQIINLLGTLMEDETEEVSREPIPAPEPEKPRNLKTRKRKAGKSKSTNKFETMDIRNMHKEDVKIDKVLNVNPPCPRTRKYSTIDVCCRSCGKKESVNPVLVTEPSRYKCNTCSTSGG